VQPAADRAELVAALRGVDYVVVFGDLTVERLLILLKPDVHCKGTDYTIDSVPERAVVLGYGGPHRHRRRSQAAQYAGAVARIRGTED
jgi:bifunctional ADP-heptose synthase (sugar kinase/adenylyltransferase)